jgi:hypothetical protein
VEGRGVAGRRGGRSRGGAGQPSSSWILRELGLDRRSVAWAICALLTARFLSLPPGRVLVGAALAGIPSLLAVLIGVHWLGAAIAVAMFALWCGVLSPRVKPA